MYVTFSAPQFLPWLWPHFKQPSLHSPKGCWGRGWQPHEGRKARSLVLADMSSDESGWRVAIPGQPQHQSQWSGSGTEQLKGIKRLGQEVWVRMRTLCPHIYLHSCGVAQAGFCLRLIKPSRSGIPQGIKTNSGKKIQGFPSKIENLMVLLKILVIKLLLCTFSKVKIYFKYRQKFRRQ